MIIGELYKVSFLYKACKYPEEIGVGMFLGFTYKGSQDFIDFLLNGEVQSWHFTDFIATPINKDLL